jgi:hypothetical protein
MRSALSSGDSSLVPWFATSKVLLSAAPEPLATFQSQLEGRAFDVNLEALAQRSLGPNRRQVCCSD